MVTINGSEFDSADDWVRAARGPKVVIPLGELRAFRQRSGILIRLRAGAMVYERPAKRWKVLRRDFAMLSGCDGYVEPSVHMRPYIEAGIAEVGRVSTSIAIETADEAVTAAGYTRYLNLAVRRLDVRHVRRKPKAA